MSLPDGQPPQPPAWAPVAPEDELPPSRPPDDILKAAGRRLADRYGIREAAVSWSFGRPLRRPHSHLLPVTAELGNEHRVAAWYKVAFVPRRRDGALDSVWLHQAREGIERGRRAAEALRLRYAQDPPADPPLILPTILAAEADALRTLMAAVPGRPLGRMLGLAPRRLLNLRRTFLRIGAAVRALEGLVDDPPGLEATAAGARLAGALRLAIDRGALPAAARADVEAHIERLASALDTAGEAAYVHGDLSGSNILLRTDGGVGFIDLDWRPRPRAFDLATYSVRLQMEAPRVDRLTIAVLEALLHGYGARAVASPGFLLERSQRWLRLLGEGVVNARSRSGRRIVEELGGGRPWLPRQDDR